MRHYIWRKTGVGIIDNFGVQFQKIVKGCNQGSRSTRARYIEAGERFIRFVTLNFRLQKIQNVSDKHLEAWTKKLIEDGKSHRYIKTELSGIRFWHRQTPQTRFELQDSTRFNSLVGLVTRKADGDRAWTGREIEEMTQTLKIAGYPKIATMLEAIFYIGMRLDEAASLRRHQVENALRSGLLHLKNTKGGRPRTLPLSEDAKAVLRKTITNVPRGMYVFCPIDTKVHVFKKFAQNLIYEKRGAIQDKDRKATAHNLATGDRGALSIHGARHSFARNLLIELQSKGHDEDESLGEVNRQLGHGKGRRDVTAVYLGGKVRI